MKNYFRRKKSTRHMCDVEKAIVKNCMEKGISPTIKDNEYTFKGYENFPIHKWKFAYLCRIQGIDCGLWEVKGKPCKQQ